MCQAFSCIITKKGDVLWQSGVDQHEKIIDIFKIKDDTTDGDLIKFAKIEITPDKGYLYPEDKWTLRVDENTTPRWLTKTKKDLCWVAFGKWKEQIYSGINLEEAREPINPLLLNPQEVTEQDIELLKKWQSVRESVGQSVRESVWESVGQSVWQSVRESVGQSVWQSVRESVGQSVRESVWESVRGSVGQSVWQSVRESVGAYIGSLFSSITEWKYAPKTDGYPYQPCVDLWKRGFVASFDGTTWRLHSGKDAKIVYEWVK